MPPARAKEIREFNKSRRGPGLSVGEVYLNRVTELLTILGAEPKHSELDRAYLAVKEAHERMIGTPERASGRYTDKGEVLMIPAQEAANAGDSWERDPVELTPVTDRTDINTITDNFNTNDNASNKGSEDASGQQSPASSNGDSGAPSGKVILP